MSLVSIIRDKSTKNNTNIPRDICGVIAKYSYLPKYKFYIIRKIYDEFSGNYSIEIMESFGFLKEAVLYVLECYNYDKFNWDDDEDADALFTAIKDTKDSAWYIKPYVKMSVYRQSDDYTSYEEEIKNLKKDEDIMKMM